MSEKSDEYEQFIASIIEDIKSTGRDIEMICSGRDCKIKGKTGQDHQIDVAFVDHSFPGKKLILVECKLRRTRNVDPSAAKVAAFNEDDIGPLKEHAEETMTIIVTTSGYSNGAQLISDSRQLVREVVPFKSDAYTFRYRDIVMGYATDRLGISDLAEATQVRDVEWGQTLIIDFKGFPRAIITDQGLSPDTMTPDTRHRTTKLRLLARHTVPVSTAIRPPINY